MATSDVRTPLSSILPPLILGTATFNVQYHPDPTHMPYTEIVRRALSYGIAGFDTSPYYGPSELLLGEALQTLNPKPPRESYFLVTKAGRIASNAFDYSPNWIRYSVCRSLERLGTTYLDLVYAHDVEFVSPAEVLMAVRELRNLRDRGLVRYVGISGYPIEVLATYSEMILKETGEPLDAVLSYCHFSVQNSQLGRSDFLDRFRAAGVDCLLNASMLGMGLLTTRGVDNGPQATWHPAPPPLRKACNDLANIAAKHGEHLEEVAIRWALENWARIGADFGTSAYPSAFFADTKVTKQNDVDGAVLTPRIGVSVMGVSAVEELEETWKVWCSVVGLASSTKTAVDVERRDKIAKLVHNEMWPRLGKWKDYGWQSGGPTFVNERPVMGAIPLDDGVAERWGLSRGKKVIDGPRI